MISNFCICSGESYAGIYVPTLVNTIRTMNAKVTTDLQINLKGFMVQSTNVNCTYYGNLVPRLYTSSSNVNQNPGEVWRLGQ